MTMAAEKTQPMIEPLSPEELAFFIRLIRDGHGWTQETLAELSGLTVRTIQRVETGKPSSSDTRRALARAFDIDEIDTFNKPFERKSEEDLKREAEIFQKNYRTLKVNVVTSGKELADVIESINAIGFDFPPELAEEARKSIGFLFDYLSEYLDSYDLYSTSDRMELHKTFMDCLKDIKNLGFSICYTTRTTEITNKAWKDPAPLVWDIAYFIAFPKGLEPEQIAIPRDTRFRF